MGVLLVATLPFVLSKSKEDNIIVELKKIEFYYIICEIGRV